MFKKNQKQHVDDGSDVQEFTPMREIKKDKSYVERRIEETKHQLKKKEEELKDIQNSIQERMMDLKDDITTMTKIITTLQNIDKTVIPTADILEMINDHRGRDFDDSDDLLNALEEHIINCGVGKK